MKTPIEQFTAMSLKELQSLLHSRLQRGEIIRAERDGRHEMNTTWYKAANERVPGHHDTFEALYREAFENIESRMREKLAALQTQEIVRLMSEKSGPPTILFGGDDDPEV